MRWFLAAGICAGLLTVAFVGCGAQGEVVKNNVIAWVNAQLGEMKVKKAEIEGRLKEAQAGLGKLQEAKIKADVRLETLARKAEPMDEKLALIEKRMGEMKGYITTATQTSAEVDVGGGKKLDLTGLKDMAGKLVKAHKDLSDSKKAQMAGKPTLEKIASNLAKKEADYAKGLAQLKEMLATINNKMVEVTAIKEAAAASGDADGTIAANFADLQGKMEDFNDDMEVVLRKEMSQYTEADKANAEIDSVDKFITAPAANVDPIDDIDAILNKAKK